MHIKGLYLLIMLLGMLPDYSCNRQEQDTPLISRKVGSVLCNGYILSESGNRFTLYSPINGRIIRLNKVEEIRAGMEIARIQNSDFIALQQDYLEAKNLFDFCKQEYTRQGELTVENATSIKKMELAKKEYQSAEIKVRSLALQLQILGIKADSLKPDRLKSYLPVYADNKGTLLNSFVNTGDFVVKGDPLCEFAADQKAVVKFSISEKDYFKVKPGMDVICRPVFDTTVRFNALIRNLNNQVDTVSHTVTGYALISENSENMISGMSVKVEILTTK
jgi:cobalt-zinc-cadmium efflux system membrane fusion protein